jgi:hypothetical protein
MDGPTTITVTTAPLAVTLPKGTATVPTNYLAPMTFSTRAPAAAATASFVHVSSRGVALPFDLRNDASDTTLIYVRPSGCLWPIDARVDITLDPGLPDGFGRPLAVAATGSFMTARIASQAADGGCAPGDGGAIDGATDGAGGDDAAPEASANDAGDDAASDVQSAN